MDEREKRLQAKREYYQRNKESIAERRKRKWETDPEYRKRSRQRNLKWARTHKDHVNHRNQKSREKGLHENEAQYRERLRSYSRVYYRRHKARLLVAYHASQKTAKAKARNRLNKAIFDGKIIKPTTCDACGKSNNKIHGHHKDYSKPLSVIWVCSPCHALVHH